MVCALVRLRAIAEIDFLPLLSVTFIYAMVAFFISAAQIGRAPTVQPNSNGGARFAMHTLASIASMSILSVLIP